MATKNNQKGGNKNAAPTSTVTTQGSANRGKGGSAKPQSPHRRVFGHFFKVATSGLATGSVLALCAASGAPGARAAANDLWNHTWLIHPFLYALIATVVCVAIALQEATITKIFLDKVIAPLLDATSHILAFSFGAFLPLATVSQATWLDLSCKGISAVVVLELWMAVFASLSIAGRMAVEDRQPISSGAKAANATNSQVIAFSVLSVILAFATYECAHMTNKTDALIEQYLVPTAEAACHVVRR